MNFNGCPYQNLFSLDLNVLREGASTTSHGNKFQAFTTLFENTFARTFSLDRFLNSLRPLLHCHIGYQMFSGILGMYPMCSFSPTCYCHFTIWLTQKCPISVLFWPTKYIFTSCQYFV